eukprot:TRINITY_DN3957_c0_g1_i1.p1 TRINITY_DN3957_c0_g1~~TRINITY_DN3957_c0_g1_i1.p1  ORF type:complete len:309 (+),score=91.45 TRINITY_DN3957_c0_g1_i1:120-1046(+)
MSKFFALFFVATFISAAAFMGLHRVSEGHVGVYWRGGALINRITDPGFHTMIPFLDSVEMVQVTVQTDKVTDIPCGTSGGVLIWIDRVEVVNRLRREYVYDTIKNYTTHYDRIWIFDKIHHEINQFCSRHTLQEVYIDLFHTVDERLVQALQEGCSSWAPGIEIIAIRITKPRIPASVLANYEKMETEKTRLLVAAEAQRVAQMEAETQKKVAAIQIEQQIQDKAGRQKMAQIEDETYLNHQKALTDAEFYRLTKEAEANQKKLTREFLELERHRSIANNTKIYFGPSVSSLFLDYMEKFVSNQNNAN